MTDNNLKVCYTCKEYKDKTEFNKNSSKKDGLQTICKICSRLKSRKYYSLSSDLHKKNVAIRKKKCIVANQQLIFDYQKSHGCIDCGENDPACLDFDHVSGIKKANVSHMVTMGVAIGSILEEIENCVIRCSNCHRKKTAKDFNWYKNIKT